MTEPAAQTGNPTGGQPAGGQGAADPGAKTQQPSSQVQGGAQPAGSGQQPTGQTQQTPTTPDIPQDLHGIAVTNEKGEVFVPLAKAKDEITKRQDLEGQIKSLQEQIFLYRMNPAMGQQAPPQQTQPPIQVQPGMAGQPQASVQHPSAQPAGGATPMIQVTPTLQVPAFLANMADDEMINAGELKNAFNNLGISIPQQQAPPPTPQYDDKTWESVGENLLISMKPDAEHVLMGAFRQRVQKEPHLIGFMKGVHPMLRAFVAYRLGSGQSGEQAQVGAQQDLNQQPTTPQNAQAEKIITNMNAPTPTSMIAGSGALSVVDRYINMSDEDMEKEIQLVKSGG